MARKKKAQADPSPAKPPIHQQLLDLILRIPTPKESDEFWWIIMNDGRFTSARIIHMCLRMMSRMAEDLEKQNPAAAVQYQGDHDQIRKLLDGPKRRKEKVEKYCQRLHELTTSLGIKPEKAYQTMKNDPQHSKLIRKGKSTRDPKFIQRRTVLDNYDEWLAAQNCNSAPGSK